MFGIYVFGAVIAFISGLLYQYTTKDGLQRTVALIFNVFFIFLLVYAALHF